MAWNPRLVLSGRLTVPAPTPPVPANWVPYVSPFAGTTNWSDVSSASIGVGIYQATMYDYENTLYNSPTPLAVANNFVGMMQELSGLNGSGTAIPIRMEMPVLPDPLVAVPGGTISIPNGWDTPPSDWPGNTPDVHGALTIDALNADPAAGQPALGSRVVMSSLPHESPHFYLSVM